MKYQSTKQAALYRKHKPERAEFLCEFGYSCVIRGENCDGCRGVSVHEIPRGKNRMRAFGVRAAWLPACSFCNCHRLTDAEKWPLPKQLALKLLVDPKYFSLLEIRKIIAPKDTPIDRLPVVVTADEVLEATRSLLIERNIGNEF